MSMFENAFALQRPTTYIEDGECKITYDGDKLKSALGSDFTQDFHEDIGL